MRLGIFAALILIFAAAHPSSASAERRVALVIGNSAYQHVPKLHNPVNDARAVAQRLKDAGFDIIESRSDVGIAGLKRALRDLPISSGMPMSRSCTTPATASKSTEPII